MSKINNLQVFISFLDKRYSLHNLKNFNSNDTEFFLLGIDSKKSNYLKIDKNNNYKLKDNFYLSIPYNHLAEQVKSYFLTNLRCLADKNDVPKFWIAYEYETKNLWSYIDKKDVRNIIYSKIDLKYLWDPFIIDNVVDLLYESMKNRLLSSQEFECISFELYLSQHNYYLIDGLKDFKDFYIQQDYFIYPIEPMKLNKHFMAVLNKDSSKSLGDQILYYTEKLNSQKNEFV